MAALLLGFAALVAVLLAIRVFVAADPKQLARGLRLGGAVLVGLLAMIALATGRTLIGLLAAAFAYGLYRGRQLWPLRWLLSAGTNREAPPDGDSRQTMTRSEALDVLGLQDGASDDDIHAAYHRLMQQIHPDHGGSGYLAAKLNQAKSVLLGE